MSDEGVGQSKKASLVEAVLNMVVGYIIGLGSQMLMFPMFDIHVDLSTNLWISFWFLVIGLVRSYALRRMFNSWRHR